MMAGLDEIRRNLNLCTLLVDDRPETFALYVIVERGGEGWLASREDELGTETVVLLGEGGSAVALDIAAGLSLVPIPAKVSIGPGSGVYALPPGEMSTDNEVWAWVPEQQLTCAERMLAEASDAAGLSDDPC